MEAQATDTIALRRQSGLYIIFGLGQVLRQMWALLLIPIIQIWQKSSDKEAIPEKFKYLYIWLGGILLLLIIAALLRFWLFRFGVQGRDFVIHKGVLTKQKIVIPVDAIQGIQKHQNLLHRLTNTYALSIDSAGSNHAEADLKAVDAHTVKQLEAWLLARPAAVATGAVHHELPSSASVMQYRLSATGFIKLWLSENHLQTLFIILAFGFSRLQDLEQYINFSSKQFINDQAKSMLSTAGSIAVALGIALVISVVVSGIRMMIRYYDYRIDMQDGRYAMRWGLLETRTAQVPFAKVQCISWRANWLRQRLGLFTMRLHALNDRAVSRETRQTLVAVEGEEAVRQITRPFLSQWPTSGGAMQQVHPALKKRYWLIKGLAPAALLSVIAAWWLGWWAMAAFGYSLYYAWAVARQYRQLGYGYNHRSLLLRRGIWGTQYWLVDFEKAQQLAVHSSPWQRRHGLANLSIQSGGHKLVIPMLGQKVADDLADVIAACSSFGSAATTMQPAHQATATYL